MIQNYVKNDTIQIEIIQSTYPKYYDTIYL